MPGGVFDDFLRSAHARAEHLQHHQVVTSSATCVLERSAQVACWGSNESGQLGDGTTVSRVAPGPVSGLTDAVLLARGNRAGYRCALRRSGEVVCWGYNAQGQLGDGTSANRSTPVPVSGLAPVGPPR